MSEFNSKPTFRFIQNTAGSVVSQGLTYNQSGLTYNTGTVQYGGFNNLDGPGPKSYKIKI